MDASSSNGVNEFKVVTGCRNDAEAGQMLEACNGNIEAAVDLYFQQQQQGGSSSHNYGEPSSSRRRISHYLKSGQQQLRRSARHSSNPNFSRKIVQDDVVMMDEDYVRPPIMPVRGAIVEQSFAEQYQPLRRVQTNSIFESFRNYEPGEEQNSRAREANDIAARRSALQNLFRPPYDILHPGTWEAARAEAERSSLWLLVNVQNVQEFACQALNRDVWSHASVKELIKSNFIFWQVYYDSADGVRIENYYHVTSHPAIFVVDPRTGELVERFRAPDPVAFCDQIGTFLSVNPDYAARDRRISCSASSVEVKNGLHHSSKNEEVNIASLSSNGVRKRPLEPNDDSSSQAQDIIKKARLVSSDVEEISDKGNKLTTVDRDEWIKYLGTPDGEGQQISLLLKFPDGTRKKIDVEDTTPLKVVFMLAAGLGYAQRDHMLTLFYPKREYLFSCGEQTIRELGFNKQEVIHVERK